MAATDARVLPVKNAINRIYFEIRDADGDLVVNAAGLDSEISEDGAAFTDTTSEAVHVAEGIYRLDLSADECNCDAAVVITKSSTTGAKTAVNVLYFADVGFDSLPTAAGIADAVWDEQKSGHVAANTFGADFVGRGPLHASTAQSAGSSTIVLAASASATDDYYNGRGIVIIGGTGTGQARTISDYTGASRQATIYGSWSTTPDGTSQYRLTD